MRSFLRQMKENLEIFDASLTEMTQALLGAFNSSAEAPNILQLGMRSMTPFYQI